MGFQCAGSKTRVRHQGELFGADSEVSYGETGLGRACWGERSWVPGAMGIKTGEGQTPSNRGLFEI